MRRPVGVKSILFLLGETSLVYPSRVATVAMLPSALSDMSASRFGSVHVGRSRYQRRRCHLFGALWFCSLEWNLGQAINAVTGTLALAFVFSLPGTVLIFCFVFLFYAGCRHCRSAAIVQRLRTLRQLPLTHR